MGYATFAVLSLIVVLGLLAAATGCHRGGESPGPAPSAGGDSAEGGPAGNHLAGQTSLYLKMHVHNPVDWYPWGEEALAKAQAERKLIFLSIGYSSCYWCHVMERESFMDEEVAQALNEQFVAIKVDREERPDIDEIYMTALQLYFQLIRSPRSGGWPLTMFLTPDARPVLGGTYFPPRDREGHTGLLKVLATVQEAWEKKPQQLRENGDLLAKLVRRQLQQPAAPDAGLGQHTLDKVLAGLAEQFDPQYGGFGYTLGNPQVPKFPQPSGLVFLLDRARRDDGIAGAGDPSDADRAQSMLTTTLECMAAGGIRDHLGGGFHRYSTDRYWAIPHFEKMLYDNGQLASVYAEAHRLTGREDFARAARETLDFVLREMTAPEGGFYSAIDAETGAEEGRYYVWDADELGRLLEDRELELLADVYGTGRAGNFEGRHVLLLPRPLGETARIRGLTEGQLLAQLEPVRQRLFEARQRRQRPATDTKMLTAWNGLMIRGLADGGRLLGGGRYVEAAEKAAGFVLQRLRNPEGRLLRSYADGRARLNAYLDDYSLLVDGLIALHQATAERRWLEEADRLTALQIRLFWDDAGGGFFFTSEDHETLIARSKDATDSALPSGNAVSAGNLVYLGRELENPGYLDRAGQTLGTFSALLEQLSTAMPRMAVSLAAFMDARR